MTTIREQSLKLHKEAKGKITVNLKVELKDAHDLSLAYSPGVAEPCMEIYKDPEKVYDYTIKGNVVGIVSDGTSVLGLGNIGGAAAMPVIEGKAALFKAFADVDAFPICLNITDPEQIIQTVKAMEPTFGGINLEDISAPNCFIIEERLKQEMNIPVFHDDQHGTAIVTASGLINALKVVNKKLKDTKVVINVAGAAGIAIAKLLHHMGVSELIMCDSRGAIYEGRKDGMNFIKESIATISNKDKKVGTLEEVIEGADIFIGVSIEGALTESMIKKMNSDPIIFAMANPNPEIMPDKAKAVGAAVIGTGRSDLPNQVNNVLAFPGIFKGALQVSASEINDEMKLAAVYAIAEIVEPEKLSSDYVIPNAFDERVVQRVTEAVAQAAIDTGVARKGI